MRGLLPFHRGLYRLASRRARTAAAVASRAEFCGTQASTKVRNHRPVSLSLSDEEALNSSPGSVCSALRNFLRRGCSGADGRSALTPGAAAVKTLFFQHKKAQKSTACGNPNSLSLYRRGIRYTRVEPKPNTVRCQVSGCLLWFHWGAGDCAGCWVGGKKTTRGPHYV